MPWVTNAPAPMPLATSPTPPPQVLPKVAAEVSAPLSQVNKITMVSDGEGPIGASKVTGEVLDIMNSLPAMVKNMTGVDVAARMAAI